jgi:hypothetical protein
MRQADRLAFAARILALGGILALGHAGEAIAKEIKQVIGNWLVTSEPDDFSSSIKVIAIHGNGTEFVAVRCLNDLASIAFMEPAGPFSVGQPINVQFRADGGEIVNTFGEGLSPVLAEVTLKPGMLTAIAKSHRLAFRISTGAVTFDRAYSADGTARAVALVQKACPLDE